MYSSIIAVENPTAYVLFGHEWAHSKPIRWVGYVRNFYTVVMSQDIVKYMIGNL